MYSLTRTILYVSLISPSIAFQFPFKVPFLKSSQTIVVEEQAATTTPRIAIIGAGAAGSSAAFWISKAKERSEIDVEVDVYERASYIGGRECYVRSVCQIHRRVELLGSTTVYPYGDPTYAPIELGASIFVHANKNLMRASKEFNLSLNDFGDEFSDMGIWDGSKFVLVVSITCLSQPVATFFDVYPKMDNSRYYKSWWTTLKILWKYGYSAPVKTHKL